MDYKELLKKARDELPEDMLKTERFEIPKVKGHVQGNKTVVTNFIPIADKLRREPTHLLKYLQRELASKADIEGPRLILNRKLSSSLINSKIEQYANTFVLCPQCNKPDTKLLKEGDVTVLKCTACGAKQPVKAKI